MNKRDKKVIYLVKYKEVHSMPNSTLTKNNTYNLFAFSDLNEAKEYMDTSYDSIINPHILTGLFKIILNTYKDYQSLQQSKNNSILFERRVKMVGNKTENSSQTKLFVFTVEVINFHQ